MELLFPVPEILLPMWAHKNALVRQTVVGMYRMGAMDGFIKGALVVLAIQLAYHAWKRYRT